MERAESQKNGNTNYSLDSVMEYLNEQVHTLTEKQSEWEQERAMFLDKIKKLEL